MAENQKVVNAARRYSVENQKVVNAARRYSVENQKGVKAIGFVQLRLAALTPFWLLSDDVLILNIDNRMIKSTWKTKGYSVTYRNHFYTEAKELNLPSNDRVNSFDSRRSENPLSN